MDGWVVGGETKGLVSSFFLCLCLCMFATLLAAMLDIAFGALPEWGLIP